MTDQNIELHEARDVAAEAVAQALVRRRRRGMNMTEIMIVVAIIVILMSILGFGALQAWGSFQVSQTKMTMSQIQQAIDADRLMASGKIPKSLSEMDWSETGGKAPQDAWGGEFKYIVIDEDKGKFDIISFGNDGKEGGTGRAADIKLSEM